MFGPGSSLAKRSLVGILLVFLEAAKLVDASSAAMDEPSSPAALEAGWTDLASGRPREAKAAFVRGLATWGNISPNSGGYVDSERGLVLTYLYNLEDATAQRYFAEVLSRAGPEPDADALLFAGKFAEAVRAYRDGTQDNAVVNPIAGPDRVVAAGAERALQGDMHGAILAWGRPAVGVGPNDLTDLQLALIGIAYSRRSDWRDAERYWLLAARTDRFVPQMAALAPGQRHRFVNADPLSSALR
jgi:hypothetical protein